MKVFRDKQCFNAQFAHMSSVSVLTASLNPDRQAPLMTLIGKIDYNTSESRSLVRDMF